MKNQFAIAAMLLSFSFASLPTPAEAAPKKTKAGAKKSTGKKKKSTKRKKTAAKSGADYTVTNFLPFGVGQFMQGRPLMGSVIGGGQAAMLYLYMDRKSQITASNNDANATIAEINANDGVSDPETDAYLKRNADYVTKTNTEANLALVGFVGHWGVGVVEAVWDPFGSRATSARKSAELEALDEGAEKWAKQEEIDRELTKSRISAFALPTTDKAHSTFGISFQKNFR